MNQLPNTNLTVDYFREARGKIVPYAKSMHGKSYLQKYLMHMYGPVLSYTESVILLCRNNKFNAAAVISRALIEAHINIIYFQGVTNSEYELARADRDAQRLKLKNLEGIEKLIKNNSNLESENPKDLMNRDFIRKTKETFTKMIAKVERQHAISEKKMMKPLDKAAAIDGFEPKLAEEGEFQRKYWIEFKYLSPVAHLDLISFDSFYSLKSNNYSFEESKNPDLLISSSVGIYLMLVKDLFENGIFEGKIPEVVLKAEAHLKSFKS